MKKFIPFLSLIGFSAFIVGCSNLNVDNKTNSIKDNFNSFENSLNNYSKISQDVYNTKLNNYKFKVSNLDDATLVNNSITNIENDDFKNLSIPENELISTLEEPIIDDANPQETNNQSINENNTNSTINESLNQTNNDENTTVNETEIKTEENIITEHENSENTITTEQISTLYSLSSDINDSCDEFCKLKTNLTNAIIETQSLINKLNSNELSLSAEQRMFVTEQSQQLKNLGRQLSLITSELSLNLSDINQIFKASNTDYDALNMKYLIVLDNLINGNEMLTNGLYSLNMINNLMNIKNPENTSGKIIYKQKYNNKPEIIKEFDIKNGQIIENKETTNQEITQTTEIKNDTKDIKENPNGNLNTYLPTIESNIDTYKQGAPISNIDTFFNTALLDNEFMYGNNANSNFLNPYFNGYNRFNNNTNYGVDNNYTTQNNQNTNNNLNNNNLDKEQKNTHILKEKKKKKFVKNVDTYKDANTPTIQARFKNIKNSISNFFGKIKEDKDNLKNK